MKKPTRVITTECKASYANVWEPNDDGRFSIALVFYPSPETEATRKALLAAGVVAGRNKFGEKFDAMVKSGAISLEGGKHSLLRTDVVEKYPGAAFYINARNTLRPGIVDERGQVLEDRTKFYSGVFCRASVEAYAFDREGNRGVTWSLGNLQRIRDGERLDNRVAPQDEFAPLAGAGADEDILDSLGIE